MDDSTVSSANQSDTRIPFGMSSFDKELRQQFGQNVRIAMACIEGPDEPVNEKAMPDDLPAIRQRLKALTQDITSQHADLLELLVRFDEEKGWQSSGACHCAAWMNLEIGISPQLGWEYLRVGRALRSLPTTLALFRAGKLTWSKIRLITRVADKDNEKLLCHAALDASVTQVKRLCDGYRWKEDDKGDNENERALKQMESRALHWDETNNGSTRIQLLLPPEIAQAFLNSVEHSLHQLEESESTMSQRRADAAVRMAETSLQSAGREFATADRYQVVVSIDASELAESDTREEEKNSTPSKRPTVKGAGPIARETARRIACDCSVTVNQTSDGEPINIGRKSRIWPAAMARAIKDRDQHCQFTGCTHTQNLQIHHIKHWADDGETSIQNGVCICSYHHTLLHEGGYAIQRVEGDEHKLNEQFTRQQNANNTSQFDFEKTLRNDKDSFDKVRKLSPTQYRFRVVDANGQDIRDSQAASVNSDLVQPSTDAGHSTRVERGEKNHAYDSSIKDHDTTRVQCAEPQLKHYHYTIKGKHDVQNQNKVDEYQQNYTVFPTSSFIAEQRQLH